MAPGTRLRMRTVGPTRNTNRASTPARTMLIVDSHWMPRATPDTAEATNAAVRTAMIATRTPLPTSPSQPRISTPLPICSAPSPSEAADPNSVAKMARTSIIFPARPSVRPRRNSGANAALTSCGRPRRKVP